MGDRAASDRHGNEGSSMFTAHQSGLTIRLNLQPTHTLYMCVFSVSAALKKKHPAAVST